MRIPHEDLGVSKLDPLLKGMEAISARLADLARKSQMPSKRVLTLEEASLLLGRTARHLRHQMLLNDLSEDSAFDLTKLNGPRKGDGERAARDIDVNEVLRFKTEVVVPMPRSSSNGGDDVEIRGRRPTSLGSPGCAPSVHTLARSFLLVAIHSDPPI